MEHLKLFSTRINIPRLIRICEEFHHWKELVFLYVQYDEYDNAAMVMMNHSPVAWEHVLFKDVAVKVSSVEVYYKAISFYLEEHPDLLNDLLKVIPASTPGTCNSICLWLCISYLSVRILCLCMTAHSCQPIWRITVPCVVCAVTPLRLYCLRQMHACPGQI